jgi:hypothetical protein
MMDIADMAIQVGGAMEGLSFVLKIKHLNFGKSFLLHPADPSVKKYVHYQTNQVA